MTIFNIQKLFETTYKAWVYNHQDEAIDSSYDNYDGGIRHTENIIKEVRKEIKEMEDTYFKYKAYEMGLISENKGVQQVLADITDLVNGRQEQYEDIKRRFEID